jgi:hypothetical protein
MEQKSIILELEEAKQELIQCVNEIMHKHGLNCYLMEPMFASLYAEVKAEAQRELAQAKANEAKRKQIEEAAKKQAEEAEQTAHQ